MTIQELRDEFLQLRYDDEKFSEQYDATQEDFQAWLDDQCLGSDD